MIREMIKKMIKNGVVAVVYRRLFVLFKNFGRVYLKIKKFVSTVNVNIFIYFRSIRNTVHGRGGTRVG